MNNKNSRKNKIDAEKYTWTLKRYLGNSDIQMDGLLMSPSDKLVDNLSAEYIKAELNERNCFDFDYKPVEGDNLEIHNPKKYIAKYISFIFRDGKWVADSYNGFIDKTEKINYGQVEFE
ncbi:hypothetical protein [Flavobacterium enshiense]|uniref:hypothetical protein n=1 Tax=Flavobacterium enshiense TaxID=1341165 RepID=UPI00103BA5AC|nr:hypothetical protein [Flavobacterium enshiense]